MINCLKYVRSSARHPRPPLEGAASTRTPSADSATTRNTQALGNIFTTSHAFSLAKAYSTQLIQDFLEKACVAVSSIVHSLSNDHQSSWNMSNLNRPDHASILRFEVRYDYDQVPCIYHLATLQQLKCLADVPLWIRIKIHPKWNDAPPEIKPLAYILRICTIPSLKSLDLTCCMPSIRIASVNPLPIREYKDGLPVKAKTGQSGLQRDRKLAM